MNMGPEILPLGMAWYVVFIISITFHEAAHSFVALKLGDRTAHDGGQVTLDPIPHIKREPFGMVILPILSFVFSGWMLGWASAPYDPLWAQRYPKRAAIMGMAGPASNLILVITAGVLIHIGIMTGIFAAPDKLDFTTVVLPASQGILKGLAIFASILFSLNLLLFVFNLIPLPPLDGRAIIEFFLSGNALEKYRRFTYNPNMRIFGLIIAWYAFDYIYPPIHLFAINLLYPGLGYQ